MRILMLGGSTRHVGGAEAFCERSREAMARQCDWEFWHLPTNTSYLKIAGVPALLKRLLSLVGYRRKGIDCIWLQYVCLPDLLYLLTGKLLGFTVMVTPHLGSNWRSQSSPILRFLSAALLALADRLALISPTQELEIRLPSRVPRSQIRNFLPENVLKGELADAEGRSGEMQLIHSGRLSEEKGTFLFIEVCRELRDAGVRFQARLTGGAAEEMYARIRKTIDAYDLSDNVRLLGRVPEEELLDLLRSSDMLIHLSTIDSYPLIVLEGIACSTYPICIDLAGASDMVARYTGHVVNRNEAIAQTVAFLKQQHVSQIRALSGKAALQVRSDYEWARSAGALVSAIRDTVRRPEAVTA